MKKTIIITGAQQGIGKAIAQHFAEIGGYNIVINDRDSKSNLEKVKKQIETKWKTEVVSCFGDVSHEDFVIEMLHTVLNKFKRVDIVVNNAGIVEDMDVVNRSVDKFNKTITNNAGSVFVMSKIFGKYMYDHKVGRIINISSTNGESTLYPTSIDYDASKAAINNLTKNFAIEFAPYVLVNAIMPGWVMTEMNKQLDKNFLESEKQRILLKKFTKPKEIAYAVEFLSGDNSNAITGAIIPVDGGLSLN